MKRLKYFFLSLVMLFFSAEIKAAKEKWANRINAPIPNNIGNTILVNDGQFNFMYSNPSTYYNSFTNHKVVANVVVGTDAELLTNVINSYDITVKVEIKFYDITNTITSTQLVDFSVTYSPNQGDTEKMLDMKEFLNYHKLTAQVVQIIDNSTGTPLTSSPINLYLV
ncbi:MAG: hypothetical protein IPL25_19210 [Saprospiraceae bacterium]|nr:hypothetical protein [Candidatus Vicinibacter affinis]